MVINGKEEPRPNCKSFRSPAWSVFCGFSGVLYGWVTQTDRHAKVGTRCSARGQLGREEPLACACRGLVQMNSFPQSLRSPNSGVRMRERGRDLPFMSLVLGMHAQHCSYCEVSCPSFFHSNKQIIFFEGIRLNRVNLSAVQSLEQLSVPGQ